MIQNPAGKANPTPTDTVLQEVQDAISVLQRPGSIIYIGDYARLVALPNGVQLEVYSISKDAWTVQSTWTQT